MLFLESFFLVQSTRILFKQKMATKNIDKPLNMLRNMYFLGKCTASRVMYLSLKEVSDVGIVVF